MRDHWSSDVPLVLLAVDDFTGKIIRSPDIRIVVPGAGRPIIKPDGFWVFPDLRKPFVQATLYGERYQRQTFPVDVAALPKHHPVQIIRVLPSRAYPFPPDTVWLEGEIPEDATLFAAAEGARGTVRLRRDCRAGDELITVFQETRKNLSGRTYLLTAAEEKDWITLTAPAESENGIYRLKTPLAHSYGKINALLSPAVTYASDAMGTHFLIAFAADGTKTRISLHCRLTAGSRREEAVFSVRAGETLRHNFMEDL